MCIMQSLLDVVYELGSLVRDFQGANHSRSLAHGLAVSLANCDGDVALEEAGDAPILVVSRTHV